MNTRRWRAIVHGLVFTMAISGAVSAASLVKGSRWSEEDILKALDQKASPADIAMAIKQDKADLYDKTLIRLRKRGLSMSDSLMMEAMRHARPGAGPWAMEIVKTEVARRRQQVKPLPNPVDSPELRGRAKAGDPAAMLELYYAFITAQKTDPAFPTLLADSAKAGYAPAAHALGAERASVGGKTELVDDALAAAYFRRSAEAGDPEGAYQLAMAFQYGKGVATNFAAAEHWFLQAAARGWDGYYIKSMSEGALYKLYSYTITSADNEASARWALEMIRRGGELAANARETLESESAYDRIRAAMAALSPEVLPLAPAELARLEASARAGDIPAALKLATAYAGGRGVLQNDALAVDYYRRAADKGSAEAWLSLAGHYHRGTGVTRSHPQRIAALTKAAELGYTGGWRLVGDAHGAGDSDLKIKGDDAAACTAYEKAVAAGDAHAASTLAYEYKHGFGVPKDEARAAALLKQSAEGAHRPAIMTVASDLMKAKDFAGATVWYRKAIATGADATARSGLAQALSKSGGNAEAIRLWRELATEMPTDGSYWYFLGSALEAEKDVPGAITAYERSAAIKSERNFYRDFAGKRATALKAENDPDSVPALTARAEAGDVAAMGKLAQKLAASDRAAALGWIRRAADKGEPRAMVSMALQTYPTDKPGAIEWLKKAVAAGDPEAKLRLAGMMFQGADMPKDTTGALALMKDAADAGFPPAQFEYGRAILAGAAGAVMSPAQGAALVQKAAEANFPAALAIMGELHERGVGVSKDDAKALQFYERAQKLGVQQAAPAVQRLRAQMKK